MSWLAVQKYLKNLLSIFNLWISIWSNKLPNQLEKQFKNPEKPWNWVSLLSYKKILSIIDLTNFVKSIEFYDAVIFFFTLMCVKWVIKAAITLFLIKCSLNLKIKSLFCFINENCINENFFLI